MAIADFFDKSGTPHAFRGRGNTRSRSPMARSVVRCLSSAACLIFLAMLGGCEGRCPGGSREVGDHCEPLSPCEPSEVLDGGECFDPNSSDGGPDAEAGTGGIGGT